MFEERSRAVPPKHEVVDDEKVSRPRGWEAPNPRRVGDPD
jgi:hypothetical protein